MFVLLAVLAQAQAPRSVLAYKVHGFQQVSATAHAAFDCAFGIWVDFAQAMPDSPRVTLVKASRFR